ncbi:MAG: MSMEG_0568 family radical SAM protein [Leptolyngbyaceae cyanobacterium CSU_1_4]|nr:MSMEG_0568 family radical SAM protein [Leptolyngbyaceae cyanobacterium CSU_1_4]
MNKQQLITELQSQGLKLLKKEVGAAGRRGGAGPSDHKAITIDGTTIMVPIFNNAATESPYTAEILPTGEALLKYAEEPLTPIHFPQPPKFYSLTTLDGVPYWKIALLHSQDVLATTILQTCIRYGDTQTSCQFCAIGQSLASDRTIARKTPNQVAEVSAAAVRLDDVKHLVMTTGTPNVSDRGAAYLTECALAVKARIDLPIQAQCEPPDRFDWFERMKNAGIDSLGMHLEVVEPEVRERIMPGKATVPIAYYLDAFEAAVKVFGRGQVSTYLLAGLGDRQAALVEMSERLIQIGVYPFIVPFVPITGTPLAHHPAPDSQWMYALYEQVGKLLRQAEMSSKDMNAGCAKCGACSALSTFE